MKPNTFASVPGIRSMPGNPPDSRDRLGADVVAARRRRPATWRQQVGDQAGRDGVQHDRRDDLADAAGDLEQPRRCRPSTRPTSIATTMMTSDVQRPAAGATAPPTTAAMQRGQPVLAVDADVEQVHLEADGDRERGRGSRWCAWLSDERPCTLRLGAVVRTSPGRRQTGLSPVVSSTSDGDDAARTTSASERRGDAPAAIRRSRVGLTPPRSSPAPVIAEPSSSGVTVARVDVGHQPAAQDHLERVGQPDQLVQVGARSAARPGRPRGPSRMWSQIAAWAPTSTPRVGCEAISTFGLAAHLAADDQLLLVAAGQRRRRATSMPGVRTSYSSTIRSVSRAGAARGRSSGPVDVGRAAVWWPSIRFSHSGASSSRPCRCRSSGM